MGKLWVHCYQGTPHDPIGTLGGLCADGRKALGELHASNNGIHLSPELAGGEDRIVLPVVILNGEQES